MRVFVLLLFAVAVVGCSSSAPMAAREAASGPVVTPIRSVGIELGPAALPGDGAEVYDRMFDFMVDRGTRARVQRVDDMPDSLRQALELVVSVDSLTFSVDAQRDRLAVGALVEGRRFLVARIRYVTSRDGQVSEQRWAEGAATLPRESRVGWGDYIDVLASLADDLVEDIGL
ncbi:MAG: hypothetical protein AAGK21_12660 [Bacteroidota bacterium]